MDRTSFTDHRRRHHAFRFEALLPKSPTCGGAPPGSPPSDGTQTGTDETALNQNLHAATHAQNLSQERQCGAQTHAANLGQERRSHTIQHPSFARIRCARLSRYCHFRRTPAITPRAMLQTNGALGRIKPLIVISWHGAMPANIERLKHHGRIHLPDVSSA